MMDIPESTAKAIEVDKTALFFFSNSNPRFLRVQSHVIRVIPMYFRNLFLRHIGNPAGFRNAGVRLVYNRH